MGPEFVGNGVKARGVYVSSVPSTRGSVRLWLMPAILPSVDTVSQLSVVLDLFNQEAAHGQESVGQVANQDRSRREGPPDQVVQHPGRPQDSARAAAPPRDGTAHRPSG